MNDLLEMSKVMEEYASAICVGRLIFADTAKMLREFAAYKQAMQEQEEKCDVAINQAMSDKSESAWWHRKNGLLNVRSRAAEILAANAQVQLRP